MSNYPEEKDIKTSLQNIVKIFYIKVTNFRDQKRLFCPICGHNISTLSERCHGGHLLKHYQNLGDAVFNEYFKKWLGLVKDNPELWYMYAFSMRDDAKMSLIDGNLALPHNYMNIECKYPDLKEVARAAYEPFLMNDDLKFPMDFLEMRKKRNEESKKKKNETKNDESIFSLRDRIAEIPDVVINNDNTGHVDNEVEDVEHNGMIVEERRESILDDTVNRNKERMKEYSNILFVNSEDDDEEFEEELDLNDVSQTETNQTTFKMRRKIGDADDNTKMKFYDDIVSIATKVRKGKKHAPEAAKELYDTIKEDIGQKNFYINNVIAMLLGSTSTSTLVMKIINDIIYFVIIVVFMYILSKYDLVEKRERRTTERNEDNNAAQGAQTNENNNNEELKKYINKFNICCSHTTVQDNLTWMNDLYKTYLKNALTNCICYNITFDEYSDYYDSKLGLGVRVLDKQHEIRDLIISVLTHDGDASGAEYASYIETSISKLTPLNYRCSGVTTDGASNMVGGDIGMRVELEKKRISDDPVKKQIFIKYTCLAHRMNSSIKVLCEVPIFNCVIKVYDWLTSDGLKDYKTYCREKGINKPPKRSSIRWSYTSTSIDYFDDHYNEICGFLAIGEHFQKLFERVGNTVYYPDNKTVFTAMFRTTLHVLRGLLSAPANIIGYIQGDKVLVSNAYYLIREHIQKYFKLLTECETFYATKEYSDESALKEYFKYTKDREDLKSFSKEYVTSSIKLYVHELVYRFAFIEGTLSEAKKDDAYKVDTWENFITFSLDFNKCSMLYCLLKMMYQYDSGNYNLDDYIVTVIPVDVINEYWLLVHDIQTADVSDDIKKNIVKSIDYLGCSKYDNLNFYISASISQLPTNCYMERTFSNYGNIHRDNMSEQTVNNYLMARKAF